VWSVGRQWRNQDFFSRGVQQIQLRTVGRENGDLGAVAPPPLFRGSAKFANERSPYHYYVVTDTFSTELGIQLCLDGPGIDSRWGENFRTCPDRPWGPPSLLYNGYRVLRGCTKRPGRDADSSPPHSAVV
jgi:hypothetical protein